MFTKTFDAIVADKAKALTTLRDLPLDAPKQELALRAFRDDATQENKRNIFATHWQGFLFVNATGEVLEALCPTTIGKKLIASAKDDLQNPSPMVFPSDIQTAGVITLCSIPSATKNAYKYLPEEDCSVPNAKNPAGSQPEIEGFADVPGFTYLPVVYPLTPGVKYPTGINLSQPLPTDTSTWSSHLVDWLKGMHFLFAHNDKKSITTACASPFFAANTVDIADFQGFNIVDSVVTTSDAVNPFHADHRLYLTEWKKFVVALAIHATDGSTEISDADDGENPALDPAAFATALAAANATTTTKSERDTAKLAATVVNYWRVLLCSIKTTATGEKEVHPAVLSDNFTQLLRTSSVKDALELFHRTFPAAIKTALSTSNIYDVSYEWDSELMGHAFIAALRGFKWNTRNLNQHPTDADTKLTLLPFIPPDRHSTSYRESVLLTETIKCQEALGEDVSKVQSKKTNIPFGTSITSFHDLTSTVANIRAFCKYCCKNPDHDPLIIQLMERYMTALRGPSARDWIGQHAAQHHVPILMVLELNAMTQYHASVATDPLVQGNVTAGTPIPPDTFKLGTAIIDNAIERISLAVHFGHLGPFTTHCALLSKIRPDLRVPQTPEQHSPSPSTGPKHTRTPSGRQTESSEKRSRKPQDALGVFTWAGSGDPPQCPHKIKHSHRTEPRPICMDFACIGRACPRPTNKCWNVHMTQRTYNALSPEDAKGINQWVSKTPKITISKPPTTVIPCTTLLLFDRDPPEPTPILSPAIAPPATPVTPLPLPNKLPSNDGNSHVILSARDRATLVKFLPQLTQGRESTPRQTKKACEEWARAHLPSHVQLAVNTPLGKDSIDRCFSTQHTFRHIWIFLLMDTYLAPTDLRNFCDAHPHILLLYAMIKEHEFIDFRPLQDPLPTNLPAETIMHRWSRYFTACLLHYRMNIPAAIRFVGHIHTGSHRDWTTLEPILRSAKIDCHLVAQLKRVFVDGAPNKVNATSSEANFHAFAAYGNHSTTTKFESKAKGAVQKDFCRSYTLTANPALIFFAYDMHLTPQGLVDWNHIYRKPRPIFDATFRPFATSMAVNDFTDKNTEPPILFPASFSNFLIWIYNLRITYPTCEIYICDDDVSGAFRHVKWNPNVVGMHCYNLFGFLFFCTGLTFGDNTSPAQWEVVALVRHFLAMYLWTLSTTISKVSQYLPKIKLAPLPTPTEVHAFTPAELDSQNPGVLAPDGSRKPPTYDHHVDDNLYADVAPFLRQTIAASVLALYLLLGFPNASKGIRDCVSWEKFTTIFTHQRKSVGWAIDSRALTVGLPVYKRDRLVTLITSILDSPRMNIRQIAELLGHLANATTVCRWMRGSFFNVQRLLCSILNLRYQKSKHYLDRKSQSTIRHTQLPADLRHRLLSILSRERALFLWNSKILYTLPSEVLAELATIRHSLRTEVWQIFIAQIIPRDIHFKSEGDSSLTGGGAVDRSLYYWFRVVWSPAIAKGTKLPSNHPDYIHINCLEFLVAFLQVAATVTRLTDPNTIPAIQAQFPDGLPKFPVSLIKTDNIPTEIWLENAYTNSRSARALVSLYGQLLKRTPLTTHSKYIKGETNVVADFISRPDLTLSHADLNLQTFQNFPWMRNFHVFHPSPMLISALRSCLFSDARAPPPQIPKQLGQFVPADSTSSAFVTL